MRHTNGIYISKNNSNNVTIRVTARDHAGNTASSEKQIAIDITDPVIEARHFTATGTRFLENNGRIAIQNIVCGKFLAVIFNRFFQLSDNHRHF